MHTSPENVSNPYQEETVNTIYELLFCDNIALFKSNNQTKDTYPWNILLSSTPEEGALQKIAFDDSLESRVRLLAFTILRQENHPVEEKELLGVIVEVGLDEGLDVLASYQDGTARYINYTGSVIVWDTADKMSGEITACLFRESLNIVHRIGPSIEPRRSHPGRGTVRISFLVSDGLYFGEGPVNRLFNDTLAAPALNEATALMKFLTSRVVENKI